MFLFKIEIMIESHTHDYKIVETGLNISFNFWVRKKPS